MDTLDCCKYFTAYEDECVNFECECNQLGICSSASPCFTKLKTPK
jgi:hypothetical protein